MATLADVFRELNRLVDDAVVERYAIGGAMAMERALENVSFRVMRSEHLAAMWLKAGGAKRRERVEILRQSGAIDEDVLREILGRHGVRA